MSYYMVDLDYKVNCSIYMETSTSSGYGAVRLHLDYGKDSHHHIAVL